MANAIIVTNELMTASGTTLSSTTELANHAVENVQVYQPGQSYRTSTLSPGYVNVTFSGYQTIDTISALYTNVTRHQNLLRYSNDFNDAGADWTLNELSIGADDLNDIPIAGIGYSQSLTSSANSDTHYIDQTFQLPDSDTFNMFILSGYVRDTGSANILCAEINNGAELYGEDQYLRAFFDISDGSVYQTTRSANTSSDISATMTSVSPVAGSATWYRFTLIGKFTGSMNVIGVRFYICDDSYNLTHADTLNVGAAAFQLEYDPTLATSSLSASSYYDETSGDRAAWWEATTDSTDVPWQLCARKDMTAHSYLHLFSQLASPIATNDLRINIYDADNADGYIEIGNVIVGKAFQPTYNIGLDWRMGWDEEGGSQRALGGQLYRPVNKRYRRLSMNHQWLSESEAWDDVFELDRRIGRSEGLLVIIDPASDYAQRWAIWGLQDSVGETIHRQYVKGLSDRVYAKDWSIIEALP